MNGMLVSVVMPARNAAETVGNSIRSALNQTYRPLEIVVVDDGSTDATREIVQAFGDDVRLVRLDAHSGASAARNAGIEAARGELIAFLDSDDEWLPEKLQKQVSRMTPGTSLVSCASNEFSLSGEDLGDTFGGLAPTTGPGAWKSLLAVNFIATPTVLTRRSDLQRVGGFDLALPIGEDQDVWIKLALIGAVDYVPESLVRVHVRPKSLSRPHAPDQLRYTIGMIERHVAALSGRLTRGEIRRILGERYGRLGQATCGRGDFRNGAPLVFRSMRLGYRRFQNIKCLVANFPPIRRVRLAAGKR
jgi:glycosyltransferase involved in cell wall biosynthesis